jgi:glycosyltransferase involved in cell wall biosynthesis
MISTIILTYNEELNLPKLLSSLQKINQLTYIIDSGSSDETINIAKQYNCNIFHHPFSTHAEQWQWALQTLPIETEWVLGLDADQSLSPQLQSELSNLLSQPEKLANIDGFFIKRRQIFQGKWIKHGGYYPKYLLKMFRKSKVRFDTLDLLDHHFIIDGKTEKLENDILEENYKEYALDFWLTKHIHYAKLHAKEETLRMQSVANWQVQPKLIGNPDQQILWFKTLWYRLPLYWRAFGYFCLRYFLQLGFLDGEKGFVFHFLQAFWYRVLVDVEVSNHRKTVK